MAVPAIANTRWPSLVCQKFPRILVSATWRADGRSASSSGPSSGRRETIAAVSAIFETAINETTIHPAATAAISPMTNRYDIGRSSDAGAGGTRGRAPVECVVASGLPPIASAWPFPAGVSICVLDAPTAAPFCATAPRCKEAGCGEVRANNDGAPSAAPLPRFLFLPRGFVVRPVPFGCPSAAGWKSGVFRTAAEDFSPVTGGPSARASENRPTCTVGGAARNTCPHRARVHSKNVVSSTAPKTWVRYRVWQAGHSTIMRHLLRPAANPSRS